MESTHEEGSGAHQGNWPQYKDVRYWHTQMPEYRVYLLESGQKNITNLAAERAHNRRADAALSQLSSRALDKSCGSTRARARKFLYK